MLFRTVFYAEHLSKRLAARPAGSCRSLIDGERHPCRRSRRPAAARGSALFVACRVARPHQRPDSAVQAAFVSPCRGPICAAGKLARATLSPANFPTLGRPDSWSDDGQMIPRLWVWPALAVQNFHHRCVLCFCTPDKSQSSERPTKLVLDSSTRAITAQLFLRLAA